MWLKTCLAICMAVAVFSTSPAKALLVPGSYIIELTGKTEKGRSVVGAGIFDIDLVGNVENFALDLLSDGMSANANSRYVDDSLSNTTGGLQMLLGFAESGIGEGEIFFDGEDEWDCETPFCSSSGGLLDDPSGLYSVSRVPLPAAIWLLLTALGGLGMVRWRSHKQATA